MKLTELDLISYTDLPLDETRNGVCPSCGERKFYVTRKTSGLAYICFRASCALEPGMIFEASMPSGTFVQDVRTKKTKRRFTQETYVPDWKDRHFFYDRFWIDFENPKTMARYVKVTEDDRYAMPVYGPRQEFRGWNIRRPNWSGVSVAPRDDCKGDDYPKTVLYLEDNCKARAAWYGDPGGTLVIVEDQVSAMRVAPLARSVAILGTHLKDEVVSEILREGPFGHVIVALDPDAYSKALGIVSKWHGVLPMSAAFLDCDPKDYPTDTDLIRDLGL